MSTPKQEWSAQLAPAQLGPEIMQLLQLDSLSLYKMLFCCYSDENPVKTSHAY